MKENNSLVSIVVPVYKVEKTLTDCIDCLINQTYRNLEIVLVDDGSPDKCPKLCEEYAARYNNIQVIHQSNKGLPGARNTGLKSAKGDWILFLDSDDWISEDSIEKLLNLVDDNTEVAIFNYVEKEQYKPVKITQGSGQNKKLSASEIMLVLEDVISPMKKRGIRINGGIVPAWCKLYSKQFLEKNELRFYEEVRIHEDIPFAVAVFSKAREVQYIDLDIYQYRYNPNSITNEFRKNYIYEMECLLNRMVILREELRDMCNQNLFEDRVAACFVNIMIKQCCHRRNPDNFSTRKKLYKQLRDVEPYASMFKNISIRNYQFKKKIAMIILRSRNFVLIDYVMKRI